MPKDGSYRLFDLKPGAVVRLACDKCGRSGQYRLSTLLDRFGRDFALPDLPAAVASDCPRVRDPHIGDACGARIIRDRTA